MLFKNLETSMIWEVENADRIKQLLSDKNYEEIKETAKKSVKRAD